ncbi:MAG: helix-turn-helix domain-containing protein [Ramlibacter sp.]|nr:helix-turn-helix domain-containing protein [Ramlibacter sp.]
MEIRLTSTPPSLLQGHLPQWLSARHGALDLHAGPDASQARPFKLLWQAEGRARVQQRGRGVQLEAGQFTLLDGAQAFSLQADAPGAQFILALPRQSVLDRHPGLHKQTARVQGERPEEALLADFLRSLALRSKGLAESGVAHAATAALALLGLLRQRSAHDPREALRSRALTLLELDIANTNAETLASQLRVSRRHLDGVFAPTGRTLSQHLWERRLALAAQQLCETPARPITLIAHGLGFKDSSHFARLFRQRFGAPPSRWRQRPTR